jgi:hypothetical protein
MPHPALWRKPFRASAAKSAPREAAVSAGRAAKKMGHQTLEFFPGSVVRSRRVLPAFDEISKTHSVEFALGIRIAAFCGLAVFNQRQVTILKWHISRRWLRHEAAT